MAMLHPDIAILDETDSGLDIDALRTVAEGVQRLHDEQGLGALIITHYSASSTTSSRSSSIS